MKKLQLVSGIIGIFKDLVVVIFLALVSYILFSHFILNLKGPNG